MIVTIMPLPSTWCSSAGSISFRMLAGFVLDCSTSLVLAVPRWMLRGLCLIVVEVPRFGCCLGCA